MLFRIGVVALGCMVASLNCGATTHVPGANPIILHNQSVPQSWSELSKEEQKALANQYAKERHVQEIVQKIVKDAEPWWKGPTNALTIGANVFALYGARTSASLWPILMVNYVAHLFSWGAQWVSKYTFGCYVQHELKRKFGQLGLLPPEELNKPLSLIGKVQKIWTDSKEWVRRKYDEDKWRFVQCVAGICAGVAAIWYLSRPHLLSIENKRLAKQNKEYSAKEKSFTLERQYLTHAVNYLSGENSVLNVQISGLQREINSLQEQLYPNSIPQS